VVVVIPRPKGTFENPWKLRVAKKNKSKKSSFADSEVKILRYRSEPGGEIEPKLFIDGKLKRVLSYEKIYHGNRITLNFENEQQLMFSAKQGNWRWSSSRVINKDCAPLLEAIRETFLKNDPSGGQTQEAYQKKTRYQEMGKSIRVLKKHQQKMYHNRRLAARRPVNYGNHFPPFVRTCQEILDALDDAGVDH